MFLGGVAKINSILVMVLRNTNRLSDGVKKYQQAFLAPLLVMDLKPPHLVIALGNANRHSSDGDGQKMVIKCSNLENKKEENKMGSRQRYKI